MAGVTNDFNEKASIEKNDSASSITPTPKQHNKNVLQVENINARLANPLDGIPAEQLMSEAEEFAKVHNLGHLAEEFRKGALIAQNPAAFESLTQLSEDDKAILRREITHKWDQPAQLYYLVILCSMAAAVQGMDETVINGANLFFAPQFGIDPNTTTGDPGRNQWLLGLVNSAPYLCCAVLGCWLTDPLNKWFGRRGTIFIAAVFSFVTCIWQGVTNSWEHLFVARLVLGLGIGPKSTTVPVYAAECTPAVVRGGLVMMWQMWTAFGIMLGYVMDLAFYKVKSSHVDGLNWRLMLGSAGVPALILAVQVFLCPESPRWLMGKGRYDKAYESLARLRRHPIQAARDMYYIHVLLEAEREIEGRTNRYLEMFTIPRNRRAALASWVVMFMQQFCGVNVISYYSSSIFSASGFSEVSALAASLGFGILNWLFAIPAVYTIDTFGRRNLLLTTFPAMSACLLLTGFAFWIPDTNARIGVVALGIYLFCIFYSPGEGPVPFTYSAEAFPLYIREIGMSFAVATTWFFNFILAITWPRLQGAFKPQGAFGWYAAWNLVGFVAVLMFVPETKALSLEELDMVFSVPTTRHASYQVKALFHNFRRYILRRKLEPLPPLYHFEGQIGEKHYAPGGAGF